MSKQQNRQKNPSDLWIAVDNHLGVAAGAFHRLCCETTPADEFLWRVV